LLGQVIGQLRGADPVAWAPPGEVTGPEAPDTVSPLDARVVLRPSGDLDLARAGQVREEIYAVHAERTGALRVDLSDVRFIDSVGISVLVAAYKRFHRDGRTLEIVVPAHLRPNFEITGLTSFFDIVPAEPT